MSAPAHRRVVLVSAATRVLLPGAALLAIGLAGCESTQSKSARLAREATAAPAQKGLDVGARSKDVSVREAAVVSDENGAAVAVILRNRGSQDEAGVPLLVDVSDASGSSVFRNDAPGLQRSLTHAPLVPARGDALWVNDQIPAAGTARAVEVTVGSASRTGQPPPASLEAGEPKLDEDPLSGVIATGLVTNRGNEDVRRALIAVIARRKGKIVAAGRGVVSRVPAGKRARFKVFFIGDPRGASLQVAAQAPEAQELP